MSRGLGEIERTIITVLAKVHKINWRGGHCRASVLAWLVARELKKPGARPSPALAQSVRRALGRLAVKGVVVHRPDGEWEIALGSPRARAARKKTQDRRREERRKRREERTREQTRRAQEAEEDFRRDGVGSDDSFTREELERFLFGRRPTADLEKLAKIMGMTGSKFKREKRNAWNLAHAELNRLGITWRQAFGVDPIR